MELCRVASSDRHLGMTWSKCDSPFMRNRPSERLQGLRLIVVLHVQVANEIKENTKKSWGSAAEETKKLARDVTQKVKSTVGND